jgi:Protein of unknown function (DUF2971)
MAGPPVVHRRAVPPGVEKQTLRAASVVSGFRAGGGGDEQVGVRGGIMDKSDNTKLQTLFFPNLFKRKAEIETSDVLFSHYTSAETAIKIIDNKQVWLRNARLMNDYSEITHGQNCLTNSWNDENLGREFIEVFDEIDKTIIPSIEGMLNSFRYHRDFESYMVSLSEHGNPPDTDHENKYGRLSMWRAYGGDCNIAFLFKREPFFREDVAFGAFISPVLYVESDEFKSHFKDWTRGLRENIDLLKSQDVTLIKDLLLSAFHFATLSLKHPGFKEEREWRVVLSPTLYPGSSYKKTVKCLGGIPQIVYTLDLNQPNSDGEKPISLNQILERIIIGPSENPIAIASALIERLKESGVENPELKVSRSEIPLKR